MQISFVEKLHVSLTKWSVNIKKCPWELENCTWTSKIAHKYHKICANVCPDTKCRLVPIKLRVVRLPRLRLSGVMIWDQIERSSIVYYKYMNFIPLLYNLKHCHAISAQCAKMESNNDGIKKKCFEIIIKHISRKSRHSASKFSIGFVSSFIS